MITSQPDDWALAILLAAVTVGTVAASYLTVQAWRGIVALWVGLFGEEATD